MDTKENPFFLEENYDLRNGQVQVLVKAKEVRSLRSALIRLTNPSGRYRLRSAEYLGGLGGEDEVITLVVDKAEGVYLGATRIRLRDRVGVDGDVSLFRLTFEPSSSTAKSVSREVSGRAPDQPYNAVTLNGSIDENNIVHLNWRELNRGDGNCDGLVDIADMVPIAEYFFQSAPGTLDNPVDLADYNADGVVDIADVARLAEAFFKGLSGFDVEYSLTGGEPFTKIPHDGGTQPTLVRTELFPGPPTNQNGFYRWTFDYGPIEGTYTFRVVPIGPDGSQGIPSANTVELTGIVQFAEVRIVLPEGHPGYLVITEEAIDSIQGNEQPFVDAQVQLKAEGRPASQTEFVDGTERVTWLITRSPSSAEITNTSPGKGLLKAKDIGVVTVLAFDPDDINASAEVDIPIYAISSLELKEFSQTEPADVTAAKGASVKFTVTGIFDDNDSDDTDFLEFDLTPYVGWILQRPVVGYDANDQPIFEAGTFYINTQTGVVWTRSDDPDLQSGFRAFVSAVFPPVEEDATIGDGHRPVSNVITITIQ